MIKVIGTSPAPSMDDIRPKMATYGIDIQFSAAQTDIDPVAGDILHLFGLRDTMTIHPFAKRAREGGIPLIITPGFWSPYEFYYVSSRSWIQQLIKKVLPAALAMHWIDQSVRQTRQSSWAMQKEILTWSQAIVAHSQAEKVQLIEEYRIDDSSKVQVVYDSVLSTSIDSATAAEFVAEYGVRDCILSVGNFDERHNQLSLVRALRRTNIPIVFIGSATAGSQRYLAECKKAAEKINGQVLFIEHIDSPTMIHSAMKNARVHAVASWWETSGRLSIEAALCGCNVVVTDRSPFREYLADTAVLCNPSSVESIRQAVLYAYTSAQSRDRAGILRQRFSADQDLKTLAAIYTAAVQGKEVNRDAGL